jgi:hypothetical protein
VELPHQRTGGQNRSFREGEYDRDHQSIRELTVFLPAALTLSGSLCLSSTAGAGACAEGMAASESTAPIGRTACSSRSAVKQRHDLGEQRDYLGGGLRRIELDAISPSALCGIQGDVSTLNQPVQGDAIINTSARDADADSNETEAVFSVQVLQGSRRPGRRSVETPPA